MYIVVIGIGQVGEHLVMTLERERHDIVGVDSDAEVVDRIQSRHDVLALRGHGASEVVLREAGVENADLVFAVTDHDEVNLIAAMTAKQLGARRAVARVQGQDRAVVGVREDLFGIDAVIHPSALVGQEVVNVVRSEGAVRVSELADHRLELVQMEVTDETKHVDVPISRLPLPDQVLVAAIVRRGELYVPGGSDTIQRDDRIFLLGRSTDTAAARALFFRAEMARRILIIGGGVTGEVAARALLRLGMQVTIVEKDVDRADALSAELPDALILHGDGTDNRLLEGAEVARYDVVAALTADDEDNLMAALLARHMGVRRTVAVIQRPDRAEIYSRLGIDAVFSPSHTAVDQILRFTRRAHLESLTVLMEGRAELVEVTALAGARVVGRPLRDLDLPRGILIGAVVRPGRETVIPRGGDSIEPGDRVVVLAAAHARPTVDHLFRASLGVVATDASSSSSSIEATRG